MERRTYDDDQPSDTQGLLPVYGSARSSLESAREAELSVGILGKAEWTRSRWFRDGGRCWCRARVFGLAVLGIVAVAVGVGLGYEWWMRPERWESEGWYPSPKGGTVKSWEESYKKAAKLVEGLSLVEKVNITTGVGWAQGLCVGNTGPVPGKFPSLCLHDGPLGLRFADHATAWPAGLTTGATWNKELIRARGAAHGEEARMKGINVILGPSMGPLGRLPAGGRNWEGFGSDPYLQGIAAAETIRGIQSQGVIATAKHFILNEQEHFRQVGEWALAPGYALSSNVDDKTMHELYLWPFAEAVKAGVGSVMCSYQMSNNTYSCGNSKLLNGLLKDELGFQGFVQSDWLAQRSGVDSILAGLDMAMPGDGMIWADGHSLMGPTLTRGVLNGSIPIERLNDMVTRIVATWYQMGQDDKALFPEDGPNFSSWTDEEEGLIYHGSGGGPEGIVNKFINVQGTHHEIARQVAAEGTVLVQNTGNLLPLRRGGWAGKRVGIYGEDAGPGKGPNFCVDRRCNQGTLGSGWGSGSVEFPYLIDPLSAIKASFNTTPDVSDSPKIDAVLDNHALKDVRKSAADKDLCMVFINADSGEGYVKDNGIAGDRNDLLAQKGGNALVLAVSQSCSGDVVVVIHAVGPVLVDAWVDKPNIRSILLAHLPGQESGNSLTQILFGDVNPSGHLPYTVARQSEDYGPDSAVMYYPNSPRPQQNFSEGTDIDYRYLDKNDIIPRFEFGFGLSYTTFSYSDIKIDRYQLKSPLPPRPAQPEVAPPVYPTILPPASDALFPTGFHKVKKHIYPYLSSIPDPKGGDYPYPPDYHTQRTPSPAGGGEGGHPALWDVLAQVQVTVTNTGDRTGKAVAQLYAQFPGMKANTGVLRGFQKVEISSGGQSVLAFNVTRKELSVWSSKEQTWVVPAEGVVLHVGESSRRFVGSVVF